MKTLHKKIGALLLTFALLLTALFTAGLFVGVQKQTTYADTPNPSIDYSYSLYYFSDSEPLLPEDEVKAELGDYPVYYDVHPLTSAQEFEYLLYTGYFWRFQDATNVTVVMQILSFVLDPGTWDNLQKCLYYQGGVKIVMIDIIESGYGDLEISVGHEDSFCEFLKEPFISDPQEGQKVGHLAQLQDNTAFLLDGRLIGIYYPWETYNVARYLHNPTVHKLFNYFRFGLDETSIAKFETQFYGKLWEFYNYYYLSEFGASMSYSDVTKIEDVVNFWTESYERIGITNTEFWADHQAAYQQFYDEILIECYEEYYTVCKFYDRNIHFFVNVDDAVFADFFDIDEAWNAKQFTFKTYTALFNYLDPDIAVYSDPSPDPWEGTPLTVCAMAQWKMTDFFYKFLFDAQQAIEKKPSSFVWNIKDLPVYLWIKDPIIWGSGLKVIAKEQSGLSEWQRKEMLKLVAGIVDDVKDN